MKDMVDLRPGDRFLRLGVLTTVLGTPEPDPEEFFGRPGMFRVWCRREDTTAEGWLPFGPAGVVRLVEDADLPEG